MTDGIIQDRESSRRMFVNVWNKHNSGTPLQPLEKIILDVISEHPEYHYLMSNNNEILMQNFPPEREQTNPFLHMGMHIAIREQVRANRPAGITGIYMKLRESFDSAHAMEHRIMECLGKTLWTAQRNNTLPDEAAYLECIKSIS